LNEALLVKAVGERVLKTDRLRADTTVVPGDVGYPTDSGLLARGVIRVVALVAVVHRLGLATRTTMRDRTRSMRRRAHDLGAWLRRRTDQAKDEAAAINAEMAAIAEASLIEARVVARNARRSVRRAGVDASGKAIAALAELDTLIERLERIVARDPAAPGRGHARLGDPAGEPARRRRPSDQEGTPRQAC
jgi:IS5 family transposase